MPASSAHRPQVLTALRAATAGRHAVLDSSMPLSKGQATLSDYRDHLLLLKAWLDPLENWLARFADGPQDLNVLPLVQRMPLIESDLSNPATPPARALRAAAFPPSDRADAAYRWGVCYVVEGSQLGGAVLYKRLRSQLAPHPLRYLAGGDEPVGARWQRFLQAMQQNVTGEAAIARACRGATDAFDTLLALLPDSASREPDGFSGAA